MKIHRTNKEEVELRANTLLKSDMLCNNLSFSFSSPWKTIKQRKREKLKVIWEKKEKVSAMIKFSDGTSYSVRKRKEFLKSTSRDIGRFWE